MPTPFTLQLRSHLAHAALAMVSMMALAGPAQAADIRFTINGTVTSPTPTLGYTPGAAVSFSWVLDEAAISGARYSGPGPSCCSGSFAWYQDFFSTTPHLWSSITGTGLTGAWQPAATNDTSDVFISAGTFPVPYNGSFGMQAQDISGLSSGLRVNGLNVTGVQMNAVYLGLDAVGVLGTGALFSGSPPNPTAVFAALAGTYAVDRTFSDFGSIWANGPGGGQFRFRVDSLTISAVPEPGTWALWLAGGATLLGLARRRRARDGAPHPATAG